jgi:hypothetical protein
MTPRLPEHFFWHVSGVLAFFLLGVMVIVLQCYAAAPNLAPMDGTALQAYYSHHVSVVMPFLDGSFLRLIFLNGGVALFIVCVPLFWVWIWWFQRDWLEPIVVIMKGTVLILMLAMGHNSFPRLYWTYQTLPPGVFGTLYYPHGIPELFAFLAAGVFSLTCIDSLQQYLSEHGKLDLHPGDVGLFLFKKIWAGMLCIILLLMVSAFIESQVTPHLVKAALENALMQDLH